MQEKQHRKPGRPRIRSVDGEQGSKSLRRGLRLLRAVSDRAATGARLAELAEATGIHSATAYRLLRTLEQENMIWVDPDTRIYNLGMEVMRMGGTSKHFELANQFHSLLVEIAEITEDNAYLGAPTGYDGIVVDLVEGRFPLHLATPKIGSRRPQGVGAAAIAILAAYPDAEAKAIYEANLPRYEGIPWLDARQIWEEVLGTRRRGYTVIKGHIIAEATAVAVALMDDKGMPVAAIAVTSTNSRMLPERRAEIAAVIRDVARRHHAVPFSVSTSPALAVRV